MNYIHHLTGFFHRISSDNRLNPTHVSLYMALFQFWNVNHFCNPISICRQDLMRISKISAKATYHKCINELHAYGYIVYEPSNNAFKGSFVTMRGFQAGAKLRPLTDRTKNETAAEPASDRHRAIIETGAEQALVPSINYINNTNSKNQNEVNDEIITGSGNDPVDLTPKEISVVSDTHPNPVVTEPPLLQSPTEKKTKGGRGRSANHRRGAGLFYRKKQQRNRSGKVLQLFSKQRLESGRKDSDEGLAGSSPQLDDQRREILATHKRSPHSETAGDRHNIH